MSGLERARRTIAGIMAAAAVAAVALPVAAQDATIRLGAPLNAATRNIETLLDEFTAETGIEVILEGMSTDDLNTKLSIESAAGTGYFDLVRVGPGWLPRLVEAGWIEPLDARIKGSDIGIDDFLPSALQVLGKTPGDDRIWAIPVDANTGMLAYRTDLFDSPEEQAAFRAKYGYDLAPPETMAQWLDMAEFFTRDTDGDGETDLFGMGVGQKGGTPGAIWTLGPLWSFGGELVDDARFEVVYDSPEAVKALEWQRKMQRYMPRSALSWGIYDNVAPMQAGRLAMSVQLFSFTADLLDPEKSAYHDRIGFSVLPRAEGNPEGYTTGKYVFGGGGIALHADSRNPDAAWTFVEWMLGKDNAATLALAGTIAPRRSVMNDPEVLASAPAFKRTLPIFLESLDKVAMGRPKMSESSQLLRELSDAWHDVALGNADPAEAASAAHADMEAILREAGY